MPLTTDPTALAEAVRTALEGVLDPEIRRPITELGMVRSVEVDTTTLPGGARVTVGIDLGLVVSAGDLQGGIELAERHLG